MEITGILNLEVILVVTIVSCLVAGVWCGITALVVRREVRELERDMVIRECILELQG